LCLLKAPNDLHYGKIPIGKSIKTMKLFAGLRKIREFEKLQLPFIKSVVDFDIVVEIGYAEEVGKPLSLKRFHLLNICSRTTIRRKLLRLVQQGVVIRRKDPTDQRATLLVVSPSAVKTLGKYSSAITAISSSHFK
jgi:hypothetical protein